MRRLLQRLLAKLDPTPARQSNYRAKHHQAHARQRVAVR